MEYTPIAINEAMAYQAQYGKITDATTLTTYQAMFVELVNTLTEEQNNTGAGNASAISLAGWDIVVAPDNFGWGRPDPISGDVNSIAWPPLVPLAPMPGGPGDPAQPPTPAQRPNAATMDMNLLNLQAAVQQFSIAGGSAVRAMNDVPLAGPTAPPPNYFVIGDYRAAGARIADSTVVEGTTPVANLKASEIDVRLPLTFNIPVPAPSSGTGLYYWVYLRRPANPFDTAQPNQVRPNKEMVVVDAMRFPVIDAGNVTLTPGSPAARRVPSLNPTTGAPNAIYSAQRLQPYRGGHLVRTDTTPPSGLPTTGAAAGVTTICPPSPPYAYGYSEQISAPPASPTPIARGQYKYTTATSPSAGTLFTTKPIKQSINTRNSVNDVWCNLAFNDRDFASVAELLLVPGCPPGLFTKQFVEEPYPGNIFTDAAMTILATGSDDRDFGTPSSPRRRAQPGRVGRSDFARESQTGQPDVPVSARQLLLHGGLGGPAADAQRQPGQPDDRDRRLDRRRLAQDARVLRGPQLGQRGHRHRRQRQQLRLAPRRPQAGPDQPQPDHRRGGLRRGARRPQAQRGPGRVQLDDPLRRLPDRPVRLPLPGPEYGRHRGPLADLQLAVDQPGGQWGDRQSGLRGAQPQLGPGLRGPRPQHRRLRPDLADAALPQLPAGPRAQGGLQRLPQAQARRLGLPLRLRRRPHRLGRLRHRPDHPDTDHGQSDPSPGGRAALPLAELPRHQLHDPPAGQPAAVVQGLHQPDPLRREHASPALDGRASAGPRRPDRDVPVRRRPERPRPPSSRSTRSWPRCTSRWIRRHR